MIYNIPSETFNKFLKNNLGYIMTGISHASDKNHMIKKLKAKDKKQKAAKNVKAFEAIFKAFDSIEP